MRLHFDVQISLLCVDTLRTFIAPSDSWAAIACTRSSTMLRLSISSYSSSCMTEAAQRASIAAA